MITSTTNHTKAASQSRRLSNPKTVAAKPPPVVESAAAGSGASRLCKPASGIWTILSITEGTWATQITASIPEKGPVPPKNRVTSCIRPEMSNQEINGHMTENNRVKTKRQVEKPSNSCGNSAAWGPDRNCSRVLDVPRLVPTRLN